MKKISLLLLLIAFSQTIFGQIFPDLIIKDINIIPITKDTVILKKSVAILDGKIVDIAEFQKVKKNSKTKVINGVGKFLMPGLTEMHIHLPESQKLDTFLTTIVAAGITHLRVMYSDNSIDEQRKLISKIEVKPKMYYPYLLTNLTFVSSPQQMDSLFSKIKEGKYDFAKMYSMQHRSDFNDTIFDRLMISANKNKVIVCGHFPNKIRLSKVLASGFKSIEHLAGYISIRDEDIDKAIELTKKYNVYNCPTLDWDVMAYDLPFPNDYTKRITLYNAPKKYINNWNKDLEAMIKRNGSDKIAKDRVAYLPTFEKKMNLLKRLNESGNLLVLGGESGNLYQMDGFNMFEEMMNWSNAGIGNFDILKASIYNPAKFFNEEKSRGTIEVGKEANLIILDANPLSDIKNIKTVSTTFINGMPYYKSDLLKKI